MHSKAGIDDEDIEQKNNPNYKYSSHLESAPRISKPARWHGRLTLSLNAVCRVYLVKPFASLAEASRLGRKGKGLANQIIRDVLRK